MQKLSMLMKGEVSAEENVQKFLDEARRKKDLNAFLRLNSSALSEAEAVDRKLGKGRAGRLAGLAIAVKANISVEGMNISCASRTLEDYQGTFDADVIQKIRQEDGIILGITNMDEFACGSSGETSAFGPTQNPSAPGRIPGGTSSGSAAAVAAGLCDVALGSDTGGSIRNPASHCGIVGIKPSYGRVSRFGLVDSAMSFDQIGPLGKDIESCSALLEVISGKSRHDPVTMQAKAGFNAKPKSLRIGVSDEIRHLCTDKRIYEMCLKAIAGVAEKTGSSLVNVRLKHADLAVQAYYPIQYVEFFSATRKFDGRKYGRKIEESCGEEVLRRILGGLEISRAEHHGAYYRKALKAKALITKDFEEAFKDADVIMMPTTPRLPHRIGERIDPLSMYGYDALTVPANLAGVCAGTVPIGKIDNIPVGLQVIAPAFREDILISAMAAV